MEEEIPFSVVTPVSIETEIDFTTADKIVGVMIAVGLVSLGYGLARLKDRVRKPKLAIVQNIHNREPEEA